MENIGSLNGNFNIGSLYNKEEQKLENLKNNDKQIFKSLLNLKKASQDMETVFLNKCFGMIFENISIDPMLKDGSATGIYKQMMIDSYSKAISQTGTLGIAKKIEKQMLKRMDQTQRDEILAYQNKDKKYDEETKIE